MLRVEQLESRTLLAAGCLDDEGISVRFEMNKLSIFAREDSSLSAFLTVARDGRLTCLYGRGLLRPANPIYAEDVHEIQVEGSTSDDYFTLDVSDELDFRNIKRVVIKGSLGNDTIVVYGRTSQAVDVSIFGGLGNDVLTVHGFAGATLIGGHNATGDVVGEPILDPDTSDNDQLTGGSGNDTLIGGRRNDILRGNGGNDKLYGDLLRTDTNPDVGLDFTSNDILDGGDGDDYLEGGAGSDVIEGGDGDDSIRGGNGPDIFIDRITRPRSVYGDISDTIRGGEGNDTIYGDDGTDELFGDAGNDTIFGTEKAPDGRADHIDEDWDSINGGQGDDALFGGRGGDRFDGGSGNDTIDGGHGDDSIMGGEEDDLLEGYGGSDTIDGGPNNDTIFGAALDPEIDDIGADVLQGGDGDDFLDGGDGPDRLDGGIGNDRLLGGKSEFLHNDLNHDTYVFSTIAGAAPETDTIEEQNFEGFDTIDFSGVAHAFLDGLVSRGVIVDLAATSLGERVIAKTSQHTIKVGGADDGSNIERVIGSPLDDLLAGSKADDRLEGGSGNDVFVSTPGHDALMGGPGSDTYKIRSFPAADGAQIIDLFETETSGTDTLDFSLFQAAAGAPAVGGVYANIGEAQGIVAPGFVTQPAHASGTGFVVNFLTQIENVVGSPQDDIIIGNDRANRLDGGPGNDKLFGGNGRDTLVGGSGNDVLHGGEGVDVLEGGSGDDELFGGPPEGGAFDPVTGTFAPDPDVLTGGEGSDLFVQGKATDFEGRLQFNALTAARTTVVQDGLVDIIASVRNDGPDRAVVQFIRTTGGANLGIPDANNEFFSNAIHDPETGKSLGLAAVKPGEPTERLLLGVAKTVGTTTLTAELLAYSTTFGGPISEGTKSIDIEVVDDTNPRSFNLNVPADEDASIARFDGNIVTYTQARPGSAFRTIRSFDLRDGTFAEPKSIWPILPRQEFLNVPFTALNCHYEGIQDDDPATPDRVEIRSVLQEYTLDIVFLKTPNEYPVYSLDGQWAYFPASGPWDFSPPVYFDSISSSSCVARAGLTAAVEAGLVAVDFVNSVTAVNHVARFVPRTNADADGSAFVVGPKYGAAGGTEFSDIFRGASWQFGNIAAGDAFAQEVYDTTHTGFFGPRARIWRAPNVEGFLEQGAGLEPWADFGTPQLPPSIIDATSSTDAMLVSLFDAVENRTRYYITKAGQTLGSEVKGLAGETPFALSDDGKLVSIFLTVSTGRNYGVANADGSAVRFPTMPTDLRTGKPFVVTGLRFVSGGSGAIVLTAAGYNWVANVTETGFTDILPAFCDTPGATVFSPDGTQAVGTGGLYTRTRPGVDVSARQVFPTTGQTPTIIGEGINELYNPPDPSEPPTQIIQTGIPNEVGAKAVFEVMIRNTGETPTSFVVTTPGGQLEPGGARVGTRRIDDKLTRNEGYRTSLLQPGDVEVITLEYSSGDKLSPGLKREVQFRVVAGFSSGNPCPTFEGFETEDTFKIVTQVGPGLAVNSTADLPDADLRDGVNDADLKTPGLQGTLRAAIQQANHDLGPDTIYFAALGSLGPIKLNSELPPVLGSVSFDALTFTDGHGVVIDGGAGTGVGGVLNGLRFEPQGQDFGDVELRGLVVQNFQHSGIVFDGGSATPRTLKLQQTSANLNGRYGLLAQGTVLLDPDPLTFFGSSQTSRLRTEFNENGFGGILMPAPNENVLRGHLDEASLNGLAALTTDPPPGGHGIAVSGSVELFGRPRVDVQDNFGAGISATGDVRLKGGGFVLRNGGPGIESDGAVVLDAGQINENLVGVIASELIVTGDTNFGGTVLEVDRNKEDGLRIDGSATIQRKDGETVRSVGCCVGPVYVRDNGGNGIVANGFVLAGRLVATGNKLDGVRTTSPVGISDVLIDVPDIRNNEGFGIHAEGDVTLTRSVSISDSGPTTVCDNAKGDVETEFERFKESNSFLTTCDFDSDGVPDADENSGLSGGDADRNGELDSGQPNVANVKLAGGQSVAFVAADGLKFRDVSTGPPAFALPAGVNFPAGAFSFVLEEFTPGASQTIDFHLPRGLEAEALWVFGLVSEGAASLAWIRSSTARFEAGGRKVSLTVTDGDLTDGPLDGRLNLTVAPQVKTAATSNNPPVAVHDLAFTSGPPVVFPVLFNDYDRDGDTLTVTSTARGSHGRTSQQSNGFVEYVPDKGFRGEDTFAYTIRDEAGATAVGRVTVVVTAPDDPTVIRGSDQDDVIEIFATGPASGSYTINGGPPVEFNDVARLAFHGLGGNDRMIVHNPAGGLFAPPGNEAGAGFEWNGGPGVDRIEWLGGTTRDLTVQDLSADLWSFRSTSGETSTIAVTETESARITTTLRWLYLNGSRGGDTITLDDGPLAGDGLFRVDRNGQIYELGGMEFMWLYGSPDPSDDTDDTIRILLGENIPRLTELVVRAHAGNDLVDASASTWTGGTMFLRGNAGDDVVRGGLGNDFLRGDSGNDQLFGGPGADTLTGGTGDDALDGGPGPDLLDAPLSSISAPEFTLSDFAFAAVGGVPATNVNYEGTDTLVGIEQAKLTLTASSGQGFTIDATAFTGNLTVVGSAGPDVLRGGSGADRLDGRDGDDQQFGNGGNDILIGGAGADSLDGGDGVNCLFQDAEGPCGPTSDAGGPYTVDEGASVLVTAAGTTHPTQDPATFTYEWDFDNDGEFDDASGRTAMFVAPLVSGDQVQTIRVRVTDGENLAQSDSATVSIRDLDPDSDRDGVSDNEEANGPLGADANNDGTPDALQPHVASLISTVNNRPLVLIAPDDSTLRNVDAVANPSPGTTPPATQFPLGFISFQLDNITIGGTATVTIPLPAGVTASSYFKFGPTADDATPHFYEFLFDAASGTGAEIFADRVVLHLVDGGRGDADGVANGVIVDPGAPAKAVPPVRVGAADLMTNAAGVTAIEIAFTTPLDDGDVAQLTAPGNFVLTLPGKDKLFNGRGDKRAAFATAAYDADTQTITLTPRAPIKPGQLFQVTVLAANIRDEAGNALDGDGDGTAGGDFATIRVYGTTIKYLDQDRDQATLQLNGGGAMKATMRAMNQGYEVQRLELVDAVPGASVLTGKFKPNKRGSDGMAVIDVIVGLDAAIDSLPDPFAVGAIAAAIVDAILEEGL
jgi:Ca2+-binding RTX toxin-like protein